MRYIADIHLHSKYSRACSRNLDIAGNTNAGRIKGIQIIGTGDFTHPKWLQELKDNTIDLGNGLYKYAQSRGSDDPVFLLSQEISCIYSQGGRVRRNHIVITAPSLAVVDALADRLSTIGNLSADGRPILGMSSRDLAELVLNVSEDCLVIPAHIWTPWFSMFGSKSGFDSVRECFGDMTPYIYAFETGLSSNPTMNWRIPELDNLTLISNGDAHSPANLGREATILELEELSYKNIYNALKDSKMRNMGASLKNFVARTIEFYPEEGKYHYDGHLDCGVSMSPQETIRLKGVCPKCKKMATVGVESRVESIATRTTKEAEDMKAQFTPFISLVPLQEIIAEVYGQGKQTKKVLNAYSMILKNSGLVELDILMNTPLSDLDGFCSPELLEAIRRMRAGELYIEPGYDGKYGVVKIFSSEERAGKLVQSSLF